MKKIIFIVLISISMTISGQTISIATKETKQKYPITKQKEQIDTYFETKISDPYRWLENDKSEETAAWVKSQNILTNSYFDKIPFREELKERMTSLWNYEKISAPFIEGDFTYYYKNDGLQNQSVLYRQDGSGQEEIF